MNKFKSNVVTAATVLLLSTVTCFSSPIENVNSNGFTVFSGKNLSTGNNVAIKGNAGSFNNTWLANYTYVDGNVTTGNNFSAGNLVNVTGNITYGNNYWMGVNGSVGNGVQQEAIDINTVNIPSVSTDNKSMWYNNGAIVKLAPGSYGSFGTSKNSKIYLSSGTYNFSNIWLGKNAEIILDTSMGDVVINTASTFSTSENVKLTSDGLNSAFIVSGSELSLGNNNAFYASLISGAGISVDHTSYIDGLVYADKDVWLSSNVEVNGKDYFARSVVPEPATAVLLLTAIPFVIKRTKQKCFQSA